MIKAQKKPIFFKLFHLYTTYWLFKRSFSSVRIRYDEEYNLKRPLLLLANHSSWWDGMTAMFLSNRFIKHEAYVLMNEKGLQRFPFFKYLGAFSINSAYPKDIVASLAYTSDLLAQGHAVWIFPQGDEVHLEKRPLDFFQGVGKICEELSENACIAPVTFYYTLMHEQRPRLYIHLGKPIEATELSGDRKTKTNRLEEHMLSQLNQQRADIIADNTQMYKEHLAGTKSVSDWFNFLSKLKGRKLP